MEKSSRRGSALALSFLGAVALVVAGCGEEAQNAAPDGARLGAAHGQQAAYLLTQADWCDDATAPTCTPTGAHGKIAVGFQPVHAGYDCKVCHYVGGRLAFQPNGPAFLTPVGPSNPRPSYDATAKTCSNIACHTVKYGEYVYWYWPDGADAGEWVTAPYGGGAPMPTPSWYSTGQGCSACHTSPPTYNGQPYAWHSGYHGSGLVQNDCQLCHPDAVSTYVANPPGWPAVKGTWTNVKLSSATNCTVNGVANQPCNLLHGNGTLNVTAVKTTRGCACHF